MFLRGDLEGMRDPEPRQRTSSFYRCIRNCFEYNDSRRGRSMVSGSRPCGGWDPLDRSCSKYIDIPNTPLYPFGCGCTYTQFEYSEMKLSAAEFGCGECITASVTVMNTGDRQFSVVCISMKKKFHLKTQYSCQASITI